MAVGNRGAGILPVSRRRYANAQAELSQQLGDKFDGVLSTDDFSVYNGYPVTDQQKCLAHLRRHFKKVVKLGHGNNPVLGQAFLDLINEAFIQHRYWQGGFAGEASPANTPRETQDDRAYLTWASGFKVRITQTIEQWIGRAGYDAGKLLRALTGKPPWGIATGQSSAMVVLPRAIQRCHRTIIWQSDCCGSAVTKRKVSGGSRSMERFAQTADLLSVVQTCRRQGRSVMKFFQSALIAKSGSGKSQPCLLPQPTT